MNSNLRRIKAKTTIQVWLGDFLAGPQDSIWVVCDHKAEPGEVLYAHGPYNSGPEWNPDLEVMTTPKPRAIIEVVEENA